MWNPEKNRHMHSFNQGMFLNILIYVDVILVFKNTAATTHGLCSCGVYLNTIMYVISVITRYKQKSIEKLQSELHKPVFVLFLWGGQSEELGGLPRK